LVLADLRIDVGELRIAILVAAAFATLAVGLKAVAERPEQLADLLAADRVPLLLERLGQLPRAPARPTQRRLRIAARRRLDQSFKFLKQLRVLFRQRLAPAAFGANAPLRQWFPTLKPRQFLQAATDGVA
jgi:hypothetical protein